MGAECVCRVTPTARLGDGQEGVNPDSCEQRGRRSRSHMAEERMPRRQGRIFSHNFKALGARLVPDEGTSIRRAAKDLDLTASALGDWAVRARADRSKGETGLTTSEREELAGLRKEVAELRMGRGNLE